MIQFTSFSFHNSSRSLALFAVAFVPWSSFQTVRPLRDDAKVPIRVASSADCMSGIDFDATLAVSVQRRVKGLSRRKQPLKETEAMLFVFEEPKFVEIWMRDTWIPLGVSFFAKNNAMTAAYDMKVEADPSLAETRYASNADALTALEYSPVHYRSLREGPRYLCVSPPSVSAPKKATKP